MLKGQEPRVLTFEEIKENEMYWMEGTYCNGIRFKPIIVTNVGDFDHWVNYYTTDGYEGMTKSEYGKAWRCWSAKPTKKQREVIPWNI